MALWQAAPCAATASARTPASPLRAAGVSGRYRQRKEGSLRWMCGALAGAHCFFFPRFFSPKFFFQFLATKDVHIGILRKMIHFDYYFFKWVELKPPSSFFLWGCFGGFKSKEFFCSTQPGAVVIKRTWIEGLCWRHFPLTLRFQTPNVRRCHLDPKNIPKTPNLRRYLQD